ncbi:hypothetical protein [Gemella sp.]
MNLLSDLNLRETGGIKKLSIQGETRTFKVYRIPIDNLIYNKKNGRIATYVSQFIDEGKEFPEKDNSKFNNIIEEYIEKSNPDALKKTKANIKIMTQTEPAVVTAEGVILDGNRRFTALRQLSREGSGAGFNFLEAVILENNAYTEKDIKRLELNLQHAIESKVDYNPIDRLVDIYRDLIKEGGMFTIEEYATDTQMSIKKVNEEIGLAKLMLEYLEFIGQSKKFYIAREQKIDGPIREIYKIINSKKIDINQKDTIKEILFLSMISLNGDITRKIRSLKSVFEDKVASNNLVEEFEELELLDDAVDYFESESTQKAVRDTGVLNIEESIKDKVGKLVENSVEVKKLSESKNKPIDILSRVNLLINDIDLDSVNRMNETMRKEFNTILSHVEEKLKKMK